jgi:hypothetical protein
MTPNEMRPLFIPTMTRHEEDGLTRRERREARKQAKRERKDAPRIARALSGMTERGWNKYGTYYFTVESLPGVMPGALRGESRVARFASEIGVAYCNCKPPNRRERRAAGVDWNAVARGTEVHPDYRRITKLK